VFWEQGIKRKVWITVVEYPPLPQWFCEVELNEQIRELVCAAALTAAEFISFSSIRLIL
jgi:hypothetical protein